MPVRNAMAVAVTVRFAEVCLTVRLVLEKILDYKKGRKNTRGSETGVGSLDEKQESLRSLSKSREIGESLARPGNK
jgi:hypothetical protein